MFVQSKEKGQEQFDKVILEDFFYNICEDTYFDARLEVAVRESVDGERENLDGLLFRAS